MVAGPVPRPRLPGHRGPDGDRVVHPPAPQRVGHAAGRVPRRQGGDELRVCGRLRSAWLDRGGSGELRAGPLAGPGVRAQTGAVRAGLGAQPRPDRALLCASRGNQHLPGAHAACGAAPDLATGRARMPLPRFVLFTGLGATVWCTILTWIGWFIGRKEDLLLSALDDEARHYAGRAVVILLPILAVLAAAYFVWHRRRTGRGSG